jgi:PAS domain S-box-containing protein
VDADDSAEPLEVSPGLAVEQAADAIMITDLGGVVRYVNQAFERTTGYPRHEIVGRHARILQSNAHGPSFYRHLWETLTRGRVWRGTLVSRGKDGRLSEEGTVISPLRNGAGHVVGYLAVKRDVSRERQSALQRRRREALILLEAITGGVAHEMNNVIMAIAGQIEMLSSRLGWRGAAGEELADLNAACDRATSLTRQLLRLGQRRVRRSEVVDADETLSGMAKILCRLVGDGIRVSMVRSARPATVLSEPGQFEQIVLRIALRARDAMPAGGTFTVAVRHRELPSWEGQRDSTAAKGRGWIEVRVSDTGAGGAEDASSGGVPGGATRADAWEIAHIAGLFKETLGRGGGRMVVSGDAAAGTTFLIVLPHVTPRGCT